MWCERSWRLPAELVEKQEAQSGAELPNAASVPRFAALTKVFLIKAG